jgi:hypothetical protein
MLSVVHSRNKRHCDWTLYALKICEKNLHQNFSVLQQNHWKRVENGVKVGEKKAEDDRE